MKDAHGSKPVVPIVIGVLGLVAVTIAIRQCGRGAPSDSVTGSQLASKSTGAVSERGGWSAQPGVPGTEHHRGASGGAREHTGQSGSMRSDAAGGGSLPEGSVPERDIRGNTRRSGATDFRDTDTTELDGDAIQPPPVGPQANVPGGIGSNVGDANPQGPPGQGQGTKPGSEKSTTSDGHEVPNPQDPSKAPGVADDSEPVLSLPLEKNVEPDKGDMPPIVVGGVTFDQNGARFAENAQMFIPNGGNVNPTAGTITFWILPDWAGELEGDNYFFHLGGETFENHIDIFKNNRYLRFLFTPNSGYESGVGLDVSNWKKGDRHMVTATWGDGVTALYVDGSSAGERDYDGELDVGPNPPVFLGSGRPGTKPGPSSNISNFQIYTRALSAEEVAILSTQRPS